MKFFLTIPYLKVIYCVIEGLETVLGREEETCSCSFSPQTPSVTPAMSDLRVLTPLTAVLRRITRLGLGSETLHLNAAGSLG